MTTTTPVFVGAGMLVAAAAAALWYWYEDPFLKRMDPTTNVHSILYIDGEEIAEAVSRYRGDSHGSR